MADPPAAERPARDRRAPRSRAVAFASVLCGGLAGLALAGQTWWSVPGAPLTGNGQTASLAGVLAGAAAAGGALAALLGRIGRRVVGVLVAAVGVGVAEPTGLQLAYAGAGLVVAFGGVLLTLAAHTWPARADRFAALRRAAAVSAEDDAGEVWKALDQGYDPTADSTAADRDGGETGGQAHYDRGQ